MCFVSQMGQVIQVSTQRIRRDSQLEFWTHHLVGQAGQGFRHVQGRRAYDFESLTSSTRRSNESLEGVAVEVVDDVCQILSAMLEKVG